MLANPVILLVGALGCFLSYFIFLTDVLLLCFFFFFFFCWGCKAGSLYNVPVYYLWQDSDFQGIL